MEGILLGMGNPLLDISANTNDDFLKKYGLEANNAILAEEKHVPLYSEMEKIDGVEFLAGGATQNSMRVAQWILGKSKSCSFMGCVGKDKYSKVLKEKATDAGVNVVYQYSEEHPTGTCAVVITKKGTCRSLVANLAAANHFKIDHLKANSDILNKAQYYYISGFFLTVSPETMVEVGKHASSNNKQFCMNLSAPFLCEFFKDQMMNVLPYVDILFGNETEAATFSKIQGFDTSDVKQMALRASALPKDNKKRSRIVIFTQGADNVVVAKDGKIEQFAATHLAQEKLIDTNGAGDAFVGGFMSQLVQEKSLGESIKCGIWAATVIIQMSGCTFPKELKYNSI